MNSIQELRKVLIDRIKRYEEYKNKATVSDYSYAYTTGKIAMAKSVVVQINKILKKSEQ